MTDTTFLSSKIPFPWHAEQWRRICDQHSSEKLAHAYLLAGPSGLGKFFFASEFAKAMLCSDNKEGKACGNCSNCVLSRQGHPDILVVAPQEGSRDIKISQIRELSEFVLLTSHAGGPRVVIVDQAHAMNSSSANALLKTLEEPTARTFLFLISDSPGALLPTIRSRCQRLQFVSPSLEIAADWLREQLAERSEEDEVSLLAAAGNRPVYALELASSGNLEVQKEYIDRACQLIMGNESIPAVLSLASKLGEKAAVGYLSQTSTILIKYLLDEGQSIDGNSSMSSLAEHLSNCAEGVRGKKLVNQLLEFYGTAQQAQQQLGSGSNPNPQLIVESLLWRWQNLGLQTIP